jgi:predicted neuraminidase
MMPMAPLALTCAVSSAPQGGGLRIERVFGPEVRTGPYKHPASIAALSGGDLYLVYYGGEGEYAVDTGVWGARLKKGTAAWSRPKLIARDPFRSVGNAVVWQAPDGTVWLFYVVRWGDTWSTSRIQAKVSHDGARTWSDSYMLAAEAGMMVRGRPIVLVDLTYLLPVYHETGHDTERVGADSTSRFLRFDPITRRWSASGVIHSAKGNIQPAVVQLSPGHLVAYCRRGGGYEPVKDGFIVRAESHDGGHTWSEGRNTRFPNPNSAVDLMRLRSGSLLLVYNPSMNNRTPLTATLSTDGGKTWPYRRNIIGGRDDFAYPFAIQDWADKIHVVFTSHERTVVQRAVFDEAWVRAGTRR